MTVSSSTNKNTYAGDDATVAFAFSFPVLDETHFTVQEINDTTGVITAKTLTTDYTVSGTGNDSGRTNYSSGTITMVTAPASGVTLVIKRNMPFKQETDYVENDTFPAETHEEALDELTMVDQQLSENLDRTLKFNSAVTATIGEITAPTAEYFLKRNSTNDGSEWVQLSTTAGLGNIVEDTTPQLGGDLSAWGHNIQFDTAHGIQDDSGNEQVTFNKTASAVNEITVTNAATGNGPSITATGDDTNVDLTIDPKGTGTLTLGSADATVAVASTMTVIDEIQHAGDTDNKVGFTTDTQTFTTGGSTRMDITDSGVQLGGSGARVTTILDEDAMGSDSATALATQQSIKAYVDASASSVVDDTTPQLGGQLDVNGNAIGDGTRELLTFTEDGSAVNHVNIENEATGSGPIISAAGDDANIDLNLQSKGTGTLVVNAGIKFPATQANTTNVNTLDDYEEGTWTAVLSDGTNNATMESSTFGHYTKIGGEVIIRCRVRVTSLGSVSGDLRVTGLPFTPSGDATDGYACAIGYQNDLAITAGESVHARCYGSNDYIQLFVNDATTGSTAMQGTEFTASGAVEIMCIYKKDD